MKVSLIDYTGLGHPDPNHATNVLIFTKNTRLQMEAGGMARVAALSDEERQKELAYMANTIPSSWEFVDYTFCIEGVTRAFTHQFVRTRTASYAQQTMRVLDVDGWEHGTGPSIAANPNLELIYDNAMAAIDDCYRELVDGGAKIEDARGILPTNILTNICAKMDMRTFVDLVRKRSSSRTQGEYRDVLEAMKSAVREVHPWIDLFVERDVDKAINELEAKIIGSMETSGAKIEMIKLLDQIRKG